LNEWVIEVSSTPHGGGSGQGGKSEERMVTFPALFRNPTPFRFATSDALPFHDARPSNGNGARFPLMFVR
jgi:hypothetical protein